MYFGRYMCIWQRGGRHTKYLSKKARQGHVMRVCNHLFHPFGDVCVDQSPVGTLCCSLFNHCYKLCPAPFLNARGSVADSSDEEHKSVFEHQHQPPDPEVHAAHLELLPQIISSFTLKQPRATSAAVATP